MKGKRCEQEKKEVLKEKGKEKKKSRRGIKRKR